MRRGSAGTGAREGATSDRRQHRAGGSAFLVVLAGIAILLATAATVVPAVVGVLEFERVHRAAAKLSRYERAVARFGTDVSARPGTIEQLTRQITSGDLNSCGEAYRNRELKDDGSVWGGPYIARLVPAHGELPLEIGDLQNQLVRDPPVARNDNDPGELVLRTTGVDQTDARALDLRVDGAADPAGGKIRWTGSDPAGLVTVEYSIQVTGC